MKRLKAGDIFQISIDDDRCVFGQIVLKSFNTFPLYIVIYKNLYSSSEIPNFSEICESEIALVGGTNDARLYHGMWKVVGNEKSNIPDFPKPHFIVQIRGKVMLENFSGDVIREATIEESESFQNRWTRAPMGFEKAIKAFHGIGDWAQDFDRLTIESSRKYA
jgi:hypothetical protein